MAINELVKFCTEYLPTHPELKRTIDARGAEGSAAVASVGQKAGFDFSADEVRAVLAGELSDDELEAVAGGRRRTGSQGVLDYLKVELKQVFIAIVHI